MKTFLILALLMVVLLLGLSSWVFIRTKTHFNRRSAPGSSSSSENFPEFQPNHLMLDLLNMLQYQLMQQSQQDLHQQEIEQFWMMHEPTNDLPTVSGSPWDM